MIKAGAWARRTLLVLCMSLRGSGIADAQTMEVVFIDVEGGGLGTSVSASTDGSFTLMAACS